jgi:sporulation protein YlmC with PRC-barrel domain
MKRRNGLSGVRGGVVFYALIQILNAQNPADPAGAPAENKSGAESVKSEAESLGLLGHATKMISEKVRDPGGRTVGRLEDLVIDLPTGTVIAGLVSSEDKLVAIPPTLFFPADDKRIVFNSDKHLFRNAPALEKAPQDALAPEKLNTRLQYFGLAPTEKIGRNAYASARETLGKSVMDKRNEVLGIVKDLIIDLSRRRALYYLIQPAGAPVENLYPIPPQMLVSENGVRQGNFILQDDRQRFLSGPRLEKNFESQMVMPGFAEDVYKHYGVKSPTVAKRELTNTAGGLVPPSPTGRSDEQIKNDFLSELVRDNTMAAVRAKELNVSVQNGRIILRGQSRTEHQREQLVSAAQRVVGTANVEDHLVTK